MSIFASHLTKCLSDLQIYETYFAPPIYYLLFILGTAYSLLYIVIKIASFILFCQAFNFMHFICQVLRYTCNASQQMMVLALETDLQTPRLCRTEYYQAECYMENSSRLEKLGTLEITAHTRLTKKVHLEVSWMETYAYWKENARCYACIIKGGMRDSKQNTEVQFSSSSNSNPSQPPPYNFTELQDNRALCSKVLRTG